MPEKSQNSSSHCVRQKIIKSSPQTSTYTWHNVTCPSQDTEGHDQVVPPNRCKHAVCLHKDAFYVYGGRNGGICHRDLWRYSLITETWQRLKCNGDQPVSSQEHTMLAYKNKLYIFGGQFSYSSDKEAPLWILDLETLTWRKSFLHREVVTPSGRRGHTAVIHEAAMYIYGGYVDLKGVSNELWTFDLDLETWHLNHQSVSSDSCPEGRHGHSAVVYDGRMFVYGGMANLIAKDDFWKYEFVSCRWSRIKSRPHPPSLKGHTACVVGDQMLIYGGTSQGSFLNTLWCFHFDSSSWCRLSALGHSPQQLVQHAVIVVSPTVDGVSNKATHSYSQPQLQTTYTSSKPFEARPYSSPPRLSHSPTTETSDSTFVFKNKVVPSALAENTGNAIAETPQSDSRYGGLLQDIQRHTGRERMSDKSEESLQEKSHQNTSTANCCHLTNANSDSAEVSPAYGNLKSTAKNQQTSGIVRHKEAGALVEHVPPASRDLYVAEHDNDEKTNVQMLSAAEDILPTKACPTPTHDLILEDIEDNDSINNFYMNGPSSQYVLNDSLASSSDILNLSNNSETEHLVCTRVGQSKVKQHPVVKCLQPSVQCLCHSEKKAQSVESLAYGQTNLLCAKHQPPAVYVSGVNSDEVQGQEQNKNSLSVGFTGQTAGDGDAYNRCVSAFNHQKAHLLDDDDDDCHHHFSNLSEFSNPCYFGDDENNDSFEEIELADLAPALVQKNNGRVSSFSCSERKPSCQLAWTVEKDPKAICTLAQQKDLRKEVSHRNGSTARSTLLPAVPLVREPRQYSVYIVGGQTVECKRFGYDPLSLWKLTVTLGV